MRFIELLREQKVIRRGQAIILQEVSSNRRATEEFYHNAASRMLARKLLPNLVLSNLL